MRTDDRLRTRVQEREKPRMGDARLLNLIPCEWGIRWGICRERLGEALSDDEIKYALSAPTTQVDSGDI